VVDITEISAMVAAAGVMMGVVYYILDIRHQARTRQTDLIMRLYSLFISREWVDAWEKVLNSAFDMTDWATYHKKHGSSDFNQVYLTFELLGVLLENKLISIYFLDRVAHDHVVLLWEKMKPMIEDARKLLGLRQLGVGTEFLYNEMKKREQKSVENS